MHGCNIAGIDADLHISLLASIGLAWTARCTNLWREALSKPHKERSKNPSGALNQPTSLVSSLLISSHYGQHENWFVSYKDQSQYTCNNQKGHRMASEARFGWTSICPCQQLLNLACNHPTQSNAGEEIEVWLRWNLTKGKARILW